MKSLILLAIVITSLIVQVHGKDCKEITVDKCAKKLTAGLPVVCKCLMDLKNCTNVSKDEITRFQKDNTCVNGEACSAASLKTCPKKATDRCRCLDELKNCKNVNKDEITKAEKDEKCGASALTNLGLPVMLLVAVASFFNN